MTFASDFISINTYPRASPKLLVPGQVPLVRPFVVTDSGPRSLMVNSIVSEPKGRDHRDAEFVDGELVNAESVDVRGDIMKRRRKRTVR